MSFIPILHSLEKYCTARTAILQAKSQNTHLFPSQKHTENTGQRGQWWMKYIRTHFTLRTSALEPSGAGFGPINTVVPEDTNGKTT